MLPKKSKNIYPRTKKNITAILDFYFTQPLGEIDWLFEQRELTINQLEWIAEKVSENVELLIIDVNGSLDMTVSNAMKYGIDALCSDLDNIKQTNRIRITKNLKDLILND